MASVVVVHRFSGFMACRIFLGLNPCAPHWQVDSQPLDHQGSFPFFFFKVDFIFRAAYIHSKIEWKVERVSVYFLPHIQIDFPTINISVCYN